MISQAQNLLLERIRSGDQQAWALLVETYEGRLLAFARLRAPKAVDPQDLVQETFVSFIQGLGRFRQDCSLETYLFSMLRRKLVDTYRQRGQVCLLQDGASRDQDQDPDIVEAAVSTDPSVSWYAIQAEQQDLVRSALAKALEALAGRFRADRDLEGLKMVELLFYCQLGNSQVAAIMGTTPNQVGVFKHRCLAQVRQAVADLREQVSEQVLSGLEGLLVDLWQSLRLSCPKRNTIGGYVLGTLEPSWHHYVDWHLNGLGCHYCRANLADLQEQICAGAARALKKRIMESTVGFLSRPRTG